MEKISLKEKILYGAGTFGYAPADTIAVGYLTLFGTDVLGVPAGLFGIILLVPKILDVISDFVIMDYVDKTKSKFGRYRPWLFSCILLAISFVLMFSSPSFLTTQTSKLIWITVMYFFLGTIFETSYWCPYSTLSGVISGNEEDRTGIASIKTIFENVGGLLVAGLLFPMLNYFGEGYKDPQSWFKTTAVFAVSMVIFGILCFFGVKERVFSEDTESSKTNIVSLFGKFVRVITDKGMLQNTILQSLNMILLYMYYALSSYLMIYVLGHEEWVTIFASITIVISSLAAVAVTPLTKKFGRDKVFYVGAICLIVSGIVGFFLNSAMGLFIFCFMKAVGSCSIYVVLLSEVPEIADDIIKKNSDIKQGVVFGISSSFQKLMIALGGFLATVILSAVKYDGTLEVQAASTLDGIRFWNAASFLIIGILAFTTKYITDKKLKA